MLAIILKRLIKYNQDEAHVALYGRGRTYSRVLRLNYGMYLVCPDDMRGYYYEIVNQLSVGSDIVKKKNNLSVVKYLSQVTSNHIGRKHPMVPTGRLTKVL